MRFFQGIHWLLTWMVLYVAWSIFVAAKHPGPFGLWNLAGMGLAFGITVAAMWIRSRL